MTIFKFERTRNLRKERNEDVLERLQKGETLTSFDSYASWFPPRPIIKKDLVALGKLYKPQNQAAYQRKDKSKSDFQTTSPFRLV